MYVNSTDYIICTLKLGFYEMRMSSWIDISSKTVGTYWEFWHLRVQDLGTFTESTCWCEIDNWPSQTLEIIQIYTSFFMSQGKG